MSKAQRTDIQVVDLSRLFENTTARRTGKFVLLDHDNQYILALGRIDEFEYHAQILAEVCNLRDIDADWIRRKELLKIYDTNVSVAGGGWFDFDPTEKTFRFYGYSTAYGQYDEYLLDEIVSAAPQFASYRIIAP